MRGSVCVYIQMLSLHDDYLVYAVSSKEEEQGVTERAVNRPQSFVNPFSCRGTVAFMSRAIQTCSDEKHPFFFFPRGTCSSVSSCNFFYGNTNSFVSTMGVGLGMRKQEHSVEYIDYLVILRKENCMKTQYQEASQLHLSCLRHTWKLFR